MSDQQAQCEFCPDGHREPGSRPMVVEVGPIIDKDLQPLAVTVSYANGHHVSEREAAWIRSLIAAASSSSSEEGERAAPGVWHRDGPLGQVRWMAAWAEGMADPAGGNPQWENARKIAVNLLAAADVLEAERASLRERLTSDEAVEAGASVLRERFERWGVTGHGRDTTRALLAAVAGYLDNRTEGA